MRCLLIFSDVALAFHDHARDRRGIARSVEPPQLPIQFDGTCLAMRNLFSIRCLDYVLDILEGAQDFRLTSLNNYHMLVMR